MCWMIISFWLTMPHPRTASECIIILGNIHLGCFPQGGLESGELTSKGPGEETSAGRGVEIVGTTRDKSLCLLL